MLSLRGKVVVVLLLLLTTELFSGREVVGLELCSGIGGCVCFNSVVYCRNVNPFTLTASRNPLIRKMDWKYCMISYYEKEYFFKFPSLEVVDIRNQLLPVNCDSLPSNQPYNLISDCKKKETSSTYPWTTLPSSSPTFQSTTNIPHTSSMIQDTTSCSIPSTQDHTTSDTSEILSQSTTKVSLDTTDMTMTFSPEIHSSTKSVVPTFQVEKTTVVSINEDNNEPNDIAIIFSSIGTFIFVIFVIFIVIYVYRKTSKKYKYRQYRSNEIYKPVTFNLKKGPFQVVDPDEEQRDHEETIGEYQDEITNETGV